MEQRWKAENERIMREHPAVPPPDEGSERPEPKSKPEPELP